MDEDITYLEEKILEKNKFIEKQGEEIKEKQDRIEELEEVLWDIKETILKAL